MSRPRIIAIDGPAASGKTTLARALARHLGYLYFDTGVMYRAVTLAAIMQNVDIRNENDVVELANKIVIDVVPPTDDDGRPCTVYLNGDDVTWLLRGAEVDANVSIPSTYPGVRDAMTDQQRRIGARGAVVMVGRDIGTVVLPHADMKIYLDASLEARARRRWNEHAASGRPDVLGETLAAMRRRDQIDSERSVAPLKPAPDAVVIDTTQLDAQGVFERVLKLIEENGMLSSPMVRGGT